MYEFAVLMSFPSLRESRKIIKNTSTSIFTGSRGQATR
ncbi:hypothetical protein RBEAN4_0724 [Rickettsia bellii str. RML An4]|uniref:Uncharacterized protein n=1 Tax=Rickettsia bellii str. RML An4 TaxID=1359193 RepID=A0A0F3QAY1_RICBE|nr:hypothetical protein RBEAN4_0724 [Rickettsia bellii str. RML An4]